MSTAMEKNNGGRRNAGGSRLGGRGLPPPYLPKPIRGQLSGRVRHQHAARPGRRCCPLLLVLEAPSRCLHLGLPIYAACVESPSWSLSPTTVAPERRPAASLQRTYICSQLLIAPDHGSVA